MADNPMAALRLSAVLGHALLIAGCSVSVDSAKLACGDDTAQKRADFVLACSGQGDSAAGRIADIKECVKASERIFCRHVDA